MVLARRETLCEPFLHPPQQADYEALWSQSGDARPSGTQMRGVTALSRFSGLLRMWRALPDGATSFVRRHCFGPGRLGRAFVRIDPFAS